MREFHQVMFEYEARLVYEEKVIEVYLKKPCPLKAVKEIAEAFYIEFGTPSNNVLINAGENYVYLAFPVESQEETNAEEGQEENSVKEDDYNKKILNAALEILQENNGLTPDEIQRELVKRGLVAPTQVIGRLLNESGKAQKLGTKWYLKEEHKEWIPLTEKICYRKEDGVVKIGYKRQDDYIETLKTIPYDTLRDLYKVLDEESTTSDVRAMAVAVGIENTSNLESYLMRLLAKEFGGEVRKMGHSLILLKGGSDA